MDFSFKDLWPAIVVLAGYLGITWKNKSDIGSANTKIEAQEKHIDDLWKYQVKIDERLRDIEQRWVEVHTNITHIMKDIAEIKESVMKESKQS